MRSLRLRRGKGPGVRLLRDPADGGGRDVRRRRIEEQPLGSRARRLVAPAPPALVEEPDDVLAKVDTRRVGLHRRAHAGLELDGSLLGGVERGSVDGAQAVRVRGALRRRDLKPVKLLILERPVGCHGDDAGDRVVGDLGREELSAAHIGQDERLPRDARRQQQPIEGYLDTAAQRDARGRVRARHVYGRSGRRLVVLVAQVARDVGDKRARRD